MKYFLMLFFPLFMFSQKAEGKRTFDDYIKMADSMNYKSDSLTYKFDAIKRIEYFRDKLLISENYKNKEKVSAVFNVFEEFIGKSYNTEAITKDEASVKRFFELQKKSFQNKISREIIEYYYDNLLNNLADKMQEQHQLREQYEDKIIELLKINNYPIERYNKLSQDEKTILLESWKSKNNLQ